MTFSVYRGLKILSLFQTNKKLSLSEHKEVKSGSASHGSVSQAGAGGKWCSSSQLIVMSPISDDYVLLLSPAEFLVSHFFSDTLKLCKWHYRLWNQIAS